MSLQDGVTPIDLLALAPGSFAGLRLEPLEPAAIGHNPFTAAQSQQRHQGQRWRLTAPLPAMDRATEAGWWGLLAGLRRVGTFLAGDPLSDSPRGTVAGSLTATAGAARTDSLSVVGFTAWAPDLRALLVGDWIELRVSSPGGLRRRLHQLTADSSITDTGSGAATLKLWPRLRESAAGAAVAYQAARGVFRLVEPVATTTNLADIRDLGGLDALEVL